VELPAVTIEQLKPEEKTLGEFRVEVIRIGKKPGNEVVLVGVNGVSTTHAVLTWNEGALWIKDLGAVTGTFVNDKKIPYNKPEKLAPGDRIGVGAAVIKVKYEPPAAPPAS
jgi:pSer/pThr/pTyr-binding forkhead associated (FHA) protein